LIRSTLSMTKVPIRLVILMNLLQEIKDIGILTGWEKLIRFLRIIIIKEEPILLKVNLRQFL